MPPRRTARTSDVPRSRLPKLAPPRLPHLVKRERLVANIANDTAPAIWLEAGAGSGKTTLAGLVAGAYKSRVIWIQLDVGDRDPGAFFHYLHAAFLVAFPKASKALSVPHAAAAADWAAFARQFARNAYAVLRPPTLLVLDNFQEVMGSPVERLVAILIEELPEGNRVLLTSREPPGEPFSRLLTQCSLRRLGWSELRLDMQECADLWRRLVPDRAGEIADVVRLTEGWVSGLVLLAVAPSDNTTTVPARVRRAAFFSYFADQVFDRLPQPVQVALKACSFFERFTLPMAAMITRDPDIETVIRQAVNRNLFITSHFDADREWFQFHGLFRDFLTTRIRGSMTHEEIYDLRIRAADILRLAGQDVDAIRLFAAARDSARTAKCLLEIAPQLLCQGRHALLGELLADLKTGDDRTDAWLHFWRGMTSSAANGWAHIGAFAESRALFERADDDSGTFIAVCGHYFIAYTSGKEVHAVSHCWEQFVRQVSIWLETPVGEDVTSELIAVAGVAVSALWSEKLKPPHERLAQRFLAVLDRADDRGLALNVAAILLNVLDAWREPAQGLTLLPTLERLAANQSVSEWHRVFWQLAVGFFLYSAAFQLGRAALLADAERSARRALDSANRHAPDRLFDAHRLLTDLSWRQGRLAEAECELERARAHIHAQEPHQQMSWHIRAALIALSAEKPEAALIESTAAVRIAEKAGFNRRSSSYARHLRAVALFRLGRFEDAVVEAQAAIETALPGHAEIYQLGLQCWRVVRYLDDGTEAFEELSALFAALREKQIFIIGITYGDAMRKLCTAAIEAGIETDFVCEMIRRMQIKPWRTIPIRWPWTIRVQVLDELRVEIDGSPIAFERKMPRKPLELLAYLAATATQPGLPEYRWVTFDRLLADLWPDAEAADPRKSLEMAIHRLRKLLRSEEAVLVRGNEAKLNPDLVGTDIRAIAALCRDTGGTLVRHAAQAAQIAELMTGSFLPREKSAWSAIVRERLTALLANAVETMAGALESQHRWSEALMLYRQGIDIDQLIEPFYRGAIRCCLQLGDHAEGMRLYRRCRELLSLVLSVSPSQETEALRTQLMAEA